jgi:uncharacterized protein YndB with AHSA1/START domain
MSNKEKALPVYAISRAFKAPRRLVWDVHTRAEHLAQWWGPKGCTLGVKTLEFRDGGLFVYSMDFRNGPSMWGRFIYRELRAPEHMRYLVSFSNAGGGITRAPFDERYPLEVECNVYLKETATGTLLELTSVPHGASEAETEFFAGMFSSFDQGYGGTLDQLEGYLG